MLGQQLKIDRKGNKIETNCDFTNGLIIITMIGEWGETNMDFKLDIRNLNCIQILEVPYKCLNFYVRIF